MKKLSTVIGLWMCHIFLESEGKHVNSFAAILSNWLKHNKGIFIIIAAFMVMDATLIGLIDCMDCSFFSLFILKKNKTSVSFLSSSEVFNREQHKKLSSFKVSNS